MGWLFGTTLFASAFLLFSVQPIVGRMVLPLLGGAPAVWNTCLVFFQASLLLGYAWAYGSLARLAPAPHRWLQVGLFLAGGVFLPPCIQAGRVEALAQGAAPVPWLLLTLTLAVGAPAVALASTAPTLLRWYARTSRPGSEDPHFLYAASNLGSLAALIGYPFVIEPGFGLEAQATFWALGYGAVAVLVAVCGWAARAERRPIPGESVAGGPHPRLARSFLWWMVWAAVPSSLVMGVTQHITTDLASVPLLWVVPLAVYLGTFILAFARRRWLPLRWVGRWVAIAAAVAVFLVLSRAAEPLEVVLLLHLVFLFLGALLCHLRLVDARPGPAGITAFYLAIALGGMAGGLFNALLAPVLFRSVLEYPLALVAICLLRPEVRREVSAEGAGDVQAAKAAMRWGLDLAMPVLLGALAVGAMLAVRASGMESKAWRYGLGLGLPLVVGFTFMDRPLRFALGLGLVLVAGWEFARPHGRVVRAERTFFGVSRVTTAPWADMRLLVHGNTLHGQQWLDPAKACEPLAYYHREGPLGDVFRWVEERGPAARVGVVGLGAGAMICYARPGEEWTFYEIDPAVARAAQDTNCFTYLARCAAAPWRIVMGDARLQLQAVPEGTFDLLAMDAFSSDAIPVHLLTREALRVYGRVLRPGGLLAFHISNRYLELAPVVGALAADAGWVARVCDDWDAGPGEMAKGRDASEWVVLARTESDLGSFLRRVRWVPIPPRERGGVWTDDHADLVGAFRRD